MEAALLVLAHKALPHLVALQADFPRLDSIPFDSRHKFMATLHAITEEVNVSELLAKANPLKMN